MKFYDTHMHSRLSFDSNEDPKNYLDKNTEVITFTDHLELENTLYDNRDDIPDFAQMFEWKKQFKRDYNVDLLAGVEIGYVHRQKERLDRILSHYDFDIMLLSCHQNDQYDYMSEVPGEKPEDQMGKYVDQLLLAVENMPYCQIMTHFDYGFRIHDLKVKDLKPYEDKLIKVFKKSIENGLAFELNSKSIVTYHNTNLYEWAIPVYRSLGGNLFSLGSDAHEAKEHFLEFGNLVDLLDKFNVTEVVQFKNQELSLYSIDKLKKQF